MLLSKQLIRRAALVALTTAGLVSGAAIAGGHKADKKMDVSAEQNIVQIAASTGQFDTLIAAAKAAGLTEALSGKGPLTVFAPTDEAFARLSAGTVEGLLRPENKEQLVEILTYHVVPEKLKASDVVARDSLQTLNGKQPRISVSGSEVKIDDANVIKVDINASNGVIHVIDSVLLPPQNQTSQTQTQAMIELAISKGAPLFNHGQAKACADLYQVTAASLLAMDESLSDQQRGMLERAISRAGQTHNDRRRAWVMRGVLDDVYDADRAMSVVSR